MPAQSNFQDVVVLNQDTLSVLGERIQLGSSAGSKSIVFAQDPLAASALHFVASNNTGAETIILPDANGTVGLITAISAGTTLFSNGALSFANSNGVSFGINGGTLTASVAGGATVVSGIGVSTLGNTLGSTGTVNGTVVFAGIGAITLSQSTAVGSSATISFSVAAQSTGPAAIAAGTQTGSSGTIKFADSNGFSFGMSGSTQITATYERRITAFSQWAEFGTNWSISNGSMSWQKVSMPMHLSATRAQILMALAGASGSTGALTLSIGVYTLSGSTASLASSGSRQISWTSGSDLSASSRYGGVSGTRYRSIPVNFSMTPGDYMVGFWFRTTNNGNWNVFGRQAANIVGPYDGDADVFIDGTSVSSFTTAMIGSFNVTDTGYARTGLGALRQPGVILIGTN